MGLGPGRMAVLHRVTGARKHVDKAPAAGRGPGREEVSIHLQTFQLLETLCCALSYIRSVTTVDRGGSLHN